MSAAWRGGLLAISSTCLDTGDDYVRITMLDTSTAVPTPGPDALVGAGGGADSYAGGVGFTRNGALVIAYTESSTTEAASTWVVAIDGVNGTAPVLVAGGGAHQNSTYWARSVVVATDPIGTDTVWIANQLADPVGSWDTRVARVAVDPNPPTVTAPVQTLIAGSRVGAQTVPVRTSWSAADTGTGIARIDMAVDVAGHGLVVTGVGGTASSTVRNHVWRLSTAAVDDSYQYAATAWDLVWNSSATALGAKLTAVVYRETTGVTYHGTWHAVTGSSYLNGAARYASTAGAYASFKTSGRSFALVTTKGPTRGKASIYVDGKLKATITLKASATSYRNLAYVLNLPSSGTHTIKLVVVSGRVDVDGFVVLR